jgi:iron complex outermembrane receptor protein
VRSPGYGVIGARVGATALLGQSWLRPVFGVDNLTDRVYVPSHVLNSASGRYFEPAPGRTVFAALTVTTP